MDHTTECKPQREAQIRCELENGHKACERLGAVVTALEERLSTVLRNEAVESEEKPKDAREIVLLAHEIRSIQDAVIIQTRRLDDFLERIEL